MHAQLAVDHGHLVSAHAAASGRVMHRDGGSADRGIELGVGLFGGAGNDLCLHERLQCLARADLTEQFDRRSNLALVVIGAEQVLRDARRRSGIGGG